MLFTPDGLTIITASMDQTIRIWDRQTGEGLCTLPGHSAGVQSVALSPDGNTILSTGWDRTARLWRSVGYEREAGGGR
jgi:WD40 repeat protein